jgi:hypothetical protein
LAQIKTLSFLNKINTTGKVMKILKGSIRGKIGSKYGMNHGRGSQSMHTVFVKGSEVIEGYELRGAIAMTKYRKESTQYGLLYYSEYTK